MTAIKPLKALLYIIVIAGTAACSHVVPVTGSVPTPVVGAIPVAVGIYMDDEFRDFTHSEDRNLGDEWVISSGQLNEEMFLNLFETMFARTVDIDTPPDRGVSRSDLDALLQIKVTEYGFLTPRETGQRFFAVSFKYQILMWQPDGTPIASWRVVGYGKSAWTAFRDVEGLREATATAIRDGAAAVALGFERVPGVAAWLESKGIGVDDPADAQTSASLSTEGSE
ncbi:MAG: hypothetical protein HKN59_02830 [Gammaproteobacteria bacterium]|nr:hypothetical protein [Gammaproteobacteria bacterium]